ncbi:hypothetical protein ACFQZZ_15120 [Nocardia sp. GCM10030253]|uniref:hypothetical protein n=1 Tax=Nocardia sp. GCM10030253 TaxID=3273404 RepID=UPI003624DB7F
MRELLSLLVAASILAILIIGFVAGMNPFLLFGLAVVAAIVIKLVRGGRQMSRVHRFAQHRAAGRYSEAAEIARAMISRLAPMDELRLDNLHVEKQRAVLYSWYLQLSYVLYEAGDREAVTHAAEAVRGRTELFGPWHPETIAAQHYYERAKKAFTETAE